MKNKPYMGLIALLLLFALPAVSAEPLMKVTLSRYVPTPAEPGSYVTVYIQVENAGNTDARNSTIEVIPDFPFQNIEGSRLKSFGLLGSATEYVENYRVLVDPSAPPGTNKLKIRFTDDPELGSWTERSLSLDVDIEKPIVAIENVQAMPEEFSPGTEGKIAITVKNYAQSYLKDISLSLDLETETNTNSLTGETTVVGEIPFIPVQSSSEKIINRIQAGESHTFTFNLRAYPDATPQLYKIPLTIEYSDSQGNNFSKSDLIGVVVNSEPELDIIIDSTTLFKESNTGEVVFKFVNRGVGDIKFLNVELPQNDQFTLLTPSNHVYIGNIDSDDFDTATFDLKIDNGDMLEIPFVVTYKDANNNQYEKEGVAKLRLFSQAEIQGGNGGGTIWFILIILVIIGGVIWWRRACKKRKK